MKGRVFSKLLFAFFLVLVIGTAILDLSLRRIVDLALRQQVEQSLLVEARLLAAQLEGSSSLPEQRLAVVAAQAAGVRVTLFTPQGMVRASSDPAARPVDVNKTPELAALRGAPGAVGKDLRRHSLFLAVAASDVWVRMEYPLTGVNAQLYLLRRDILLASLVSLLLASVLAVLLTRRLEQRLHRILAFAEGIAAGDLSARLEEGDVDEISAVAHALNASASRLEMAFQSLESSRRELTALLDSMQEGVIAVTASGHVSWFNAVANRLAHQPVREGRSLVQTIRDPGVLGCVDTALRERTIATGRGTSVVPGRTFEVNAAPMPGGGAVVVLHDITEVQQAEVTRRDFVANVSHELRTPLTSITGYVETILDGREPVGPESRDFLQIILKNAIRMNRLTEDLLALARVESGDYKLALYPVRARDLVEDALATLAPMVQDAGLSLEDGELATDWVMVDPDALQQVFGNLVENATKYGRSGKRVCVASVRRGDQVEFSVQDFGPGIPSEHQRRIFERFYRVDKARSRESGGTGLGLSIARHIVHAHGGELRVESELGFGATFVFTLPRAAVQEGGRTSDDVATPALEAPGVESS